MIDELTDMPMWLQLLVLATLVIRLTVLVTIDRVARPLRYWAKARGSMPAYLIYCPWCIGVWWAVLITVAWLLIPGPTLAVSVAGALALAAGATVSRLAAPDPDE